MLKLNRIIQLATEMLYPSSTSITVSIASRRISLFLLLSDILIILVAVTVITYCKLTAKKIILQVKNATTLKLFYQPYKLWNKLWLKNTTDQCQKLLQIPLNHLNINISHVFITSTLQSAFLL